MRNLSEAVDAAEALEAAGKYKEAAELTAQSLTVAWNGVVQTQGALPTLAKPPKLPLPRRSYVERYKRRVRVDWDKWNRESRRAVPVPAGVSEGFGEEEEEDGIEEGDEGEDTVPESMTELSLASSQETLESTTSMGGGRTTSWQPKSMTKNWIVQPVPGSTTGKVELVHTCGNGKRVAVTIVPPEIPVRANHMFNANAKSTVKSLVDGDAELSPRTFNCAPHPCGGRAP